MNNRRLKFACVFALVLAVAGWAAQGSNHVASASGTAKPGAAPDITNIPRAFSYQGTLRLADGNLANGSYNLTLRVYTAVTGGTAVHTETFSNTVVRNGAFSVVVGDAAPISTTVFDNANLYLGITVAPDAEMLPRQRLFPVPWAMQAMEASTAQTAVTAQTANTLAQNATGNGLTLNGGAANTPGIMLNSSGPGWGSGMQFVNTAGNVTWGMYAGSDSHFHIVNAGGSYEHIRIENGGGIRMGSNVSMQYDLSVNGRVYAGQGFNGRCVLGAFNQGVVGNNLNVTCNQDVAETFSTEKRTEPGDLVVFVPEDRTFPTVKLSSKPYEGTLVGVVSTNPGLVFDQGKTFLSGDNGKLITDKKTVVAMVGRVPTKFSLENGPIAVGDPLTSASKPGTAMKATQAGPIIGYALQSSDKADAVKSGKILVWLQLGTYIPQDTLAALNAFTELQAKAGK
jgi:hypothetical protein